jgi:hypothetical protein
VLILNWENILYLIIGAFGSGIVSYLLYRKQKGEEEADVDFKIMKSSYRVLGRKKNKKTPALTLELLFTNKGRVPGAITDLMCLIRYSGKILETYPWIRNEVSDKLVFQERPENFKKIIPIKVDPSNKAVLKFHFKDVYPLILERAFMPLNLRNPKKWEWKDLPIYGQITVNYKKGSINRPWTAFRENQHESKEISGTIGPLEEFEIGQKFMPKIREI